MVFLIVNRQSLIVMRMEVMRLSTTSRLLVGWKRRWFRETASVQPGWRGDFSSPYLTSHNEGYVKFVSYG